MARTLWRRRGLAMMFVMLFFLWGCGYPREEKERMEAIKKLGGENAVAYVEEKYGFTPETEDIQLCMERDDGERRPWANGYVLAVMRHEESIFHVHISGEETTRQGRDDFQNQLIVKEAREYFEALLGYEIYDVYLEYRENQEDDRFPHCHQNGFISERYNSGDFERLLKAYSVSARIDDCGDRDLTDMRESRPQAAEFFEKYAADYGFQAVVISYRSQEDYHKGYEHTYGGGGLLDFDIWNDGLYICSYAAFYEEGERFCRFELQDFDGMIFSCVDREEGRDLRISRGERVWLELGDFKGEQVSQVYSVEKNRPGEVAVYIPADQYGRNAAVYIQHVYDGKWWQYKDYTRLTRDKKYVIVTYHGISGSTFDFAVFKE